MDQRAAKRMPSRKALSDSVYDILIAQVIEGRYEPGTALNIDALSRELEISQTPIREALARLEATGLVTRAALRGYRVARLFTARELDDLMEARSVIEPENAFMATTRITSKALEELAETIQVMRSSPRGASYAEMVEFWNADESFHRMIAERTENSFLQSAYAALGGHTQRFRLFAEIGITDAEAAAEEHSKILGAIEKGEPESARRQMKHHIEQVRSRAQADRLAYAKRHGHDL